MALVFFAILFLFGASGMERRRGMIFSTITGVLLFAWMSPLVIHEANSSGVLYVLAEGGALLIAFLLLSMLSYFGGWCAHILFARMRSGRSQ